MSGSRAAAFVGYTLLSLVFLVGSSYWVARDRRVANTDFPQDYTSARSWLDSDSAYRPLGEQHARYGLPPAQDEIKDRTNPHPPVAILLTVPYAFTDFDTALSWVRRTQLVALSITWTLCYAAFRPRIPAWAWAVAGGVLGAWAPLWQGLAWGQPVGLLALATMLIWLLARAERPFTFGLVLGLATLIRPFVAIQIVLVCGWSARKQAQAVAGTLIGGLVPFAVLGITPWEWYRLASDVSGYTAECGSLPNLLGLGAGGGQVLYALAAAIIAWFRWRGLDVDTTAALAAVAGLITYPLAWFHYDSSLVPVVAWVVVGATTTGNRVALWGVVLYLLMRALPDTLPGRGSALADALSANKHWIQVFARAILLGAVVALAPSRRVSANAHS